MSIEVIFLSFLIYSVIGWVYESTICSLIGKKQFMNRGFLLGPYCPIYGIGAMLCYLSLHTIPRPGSLFLASMILCSVLEYATGYTMEKLFHVKWWDYSDLPFQLHGRVCLYGAILFGIGCMLVCYIVQPVLLFFFAQISQDFLRIAAVIMAGVLLLDSITTVGSWGNWKSKGAFELL